MAWLPLEQLGEEAALTDGRGESSTQKSSFTPPETWFRAPKLLLGVVAASLWLRFSKDKNHILRGMEDPSEREHSASNLAVCKYLKIWYLQDGLSLFCLSPKDGNPIRTKGGSYRVSDFSSL